MELRHIHYFLEIYHSGNMTQSSRRLFITQQGLSKAIASLEAELGFALFTRTSTGLKPTAEAEKLFPYFENVQQASQHLEAACRRLKSRPTVNITACLGFAQTTDLSLFSDFQLRHPHIRTTYQEIPNEAIPHALLNGQFDVAFLLNHLPSSLRNHLCIATEAICVIVDRRHPLAGKQRIRLPELRDHPLTLMALLQEHKADLFPAAGDARAVQEIVFHGFLHLLFQSDVVGIGLRSLVRRDREAHQFAFIPLYTSDDQPLQVKIHLVTARNVPLSDAVKEYIAYQHCLHPPTES